jgi:hypothetical protein
MRLMLGTNDKPSLLVDVQQEFSLTHFEFWVVNGCWEGTYTNGYVTVWHPDEPWSSLDKTEILCDNQDRLRTKGEWGAYQEVFDNFHNPDYVAPKREPVVFHDMDDDIPF